MRIGILGHGFVEWSGGIDFLRLVIGCLAARSDAPSLEIHVLVPDAGLRFRARGAWRSAKRVLKAIARGEAGGALRNDAPPLGADAFGRHEAARIEVHHIDLGPRSLSRACTAAKLDVVLPSLYPLEPGFPVPWIGYIYDFQHKQLPHFFSERERRLRDRQFGRMLDRCEVAVVNARAVAEDAARYHPGSRARIHVLPFAPAPEAAWLEDRPDVLPRYGIGAPYFVISNRFWVHKDHATAFEAFRLALAGLPEGTLLVCTGETTDYRMPGHFANLMAGLEANGIRSRVKVLGLVPKRDQVELLKRSMGLVQPTRCEGGPGGGAAFDAVALGVPAILSDIPVNREVEARDVFFFETGNAAALAGRLGEVARLARSRASAGELVARGRERRARAGEVLGTAIEAARSGKGT